MSKTWVPKLTPSFYIFIITIISIIIYCYTVILNLWLKFLCRINDQYIVNET